MPLKGEFSWRPGYTETASDWPQEFRSHIFNKHVLLMFSVGLLVEADVEPRIFRTGIQCLNHLDATAVMRVIFGHVAESYIIVKYKINNSWISPFSLVAKTQKILHSRGESGRDNYLYLLLWSVTTFLLNSIQENYHLIKFVDASKLLLNYANIETDLSIRWT